MDIAACHKRTAKALDETKSGDKAMVEILSLIAGHGEEVGTAAAELAMECGMPTVAAVQNN
ncbi:hypothetical protein [Neisseria weixii]|uniref:hypothetical protein n=1 Tax=Neisseria weixii TaxID=1853276 RepID=UPI0018DFE13A|nr:hypothetical protein [Neisseria weixii]